ncbi:MAG: Uma2 family endonuclease [Pseudanabaenaceae cyanobacterium]
MNMETITKTWTDKEFMALPDTGDRYEIVNGELIKMGNAGFRHGYYANLLAALITIYVREHNLGIVCDSSTAFIMESGNRRSPDGSFISKTRLMGSGRLTKGFFRGAPDLAIEVLSDGNTVEEIHQKIEEYFASGSRLVWLIHPDERYVLVYHQPEPDKFLRVGDFLDGEDVIPGFSLSLSEFFTEPEF